MTKTLLEKAENYKLSSTSKKHNITDEHIELAVAFITGKIRLGQKKVLRANGHRGMGAYSIMLRAIKIGVEKNKIKIQYDK